MILCFKDKEIKNKSLLQRVNFQGYFNQLKSFYFKSCTIGDTYAPALNF